MLKINLKQLAQEFNDNLKLDYDLKKKNWFNIGGKTKIYYKADNLKELIKFLKKIQNKEKIFVLGAGSNTLITDKQFNGVVIKLTNNFNNISLLNDDIIIAGSAVKDKSLSDLMKSIRSHGWTRGIDFNLDDKENFHIKVDGLGQIVQSPRIPRSSLNKQSF